MELHIYGDGQEFRVQLRVSWVVFKAFSVALLASLAILSTLHAAFQGILP